MKKTSVACGLGGTLLLLMTLPACLRSPHSSPVPVGNDTSIKFPDFSDRRPIVVGEADVPYQLDGVTLRAIMIAANDYIPSGTREDDCQDRQEAQLYRVIRQGDIVFVSVSFNSSFCRPKLFSLDDGARYAISTDGRILRRLVGIEPDGLPREEPPSQGILVPKHLVGAPSAELRNYLQDAGIPDAGVPLADGGALAPDGAEN